MRLPSPSETAGSSGHERSPLEPPTFTDGESARAEAEKRPQPTEQPTAASILAEGSLNLQNNRNIV